MTQGNDVTGKRYYCATWSMIDKITPRPHEKVKELYAGPGAVRKTLHKYVLAR